MLMPPLQLKSPVMVMALVTGLALENKPRPLPCIGIERSSKVKLTGPNGFPSEQYPVASRGAPRIVVYLNPDAEAAARE